MSRTLLPPKLEPRKQPIIRPHAIRGALTLLFYTVVLILCVSFVFWACDVRIPGF